MHNTRSSPFFLTAPQDPEESDAYEDDISGGEGGKKRKAAEPENFAVLDGSISLNDEGRVSCSGTWAMKKDLDAAAASANGENKDDKAEEEKKDGDGGGKKSKKKKQKFKLKSKQIMISSDGSSSGSGPVFLLDNPTVKKKKDPQTIPSNRTMLFDGFFFTPEEEGHKKIKEKDVEITFSVIEGQSGSFKVEGKGSNEFGAFTIDGTYSVNGGAEKNSLVCNKKYVPVVGAADEYDDDDDDEMSDAADADYGELVALNEEATMSVEELRKRYYGGHADDDVEDAEPTAKKAKVVADDSDDDGCGF